MYGKAAGFRRNAEMHNYIKNQDNRMCICFWDGKSTGTQHNFKLAKDADTLLYVYNYNDRNYMQYTCKQKNKNEVKNKMTSYNCDKAIFTKIDEPLL